MKKGISCFMCICLAIITMVLTFNENSNVYAYSGFDDITAKSYVVIDASGNVLIEKNSDAHREVASICKLMTTLITLENIDKGNITIEEKFVASTFACDAEGSQAFLDAGSEYSVGDLLKSVIVASANDSAIVLAEGIAGSEKNFVSLMNKKAKELGMNETIYANSTGLPAMEQHSTCKDTAILINEVSKYPLYQKDCQIWMDSLTHPSGRKTELVNTNRLIKYFPYCKTGKTGFTDEAGYCLATTSVKDDMKLTCVVLGSSTSANRFKESVELYNYAYANFVDELVIDSTKTIDNDIKVVGGKLNTIELKPEKDFYLTQNRNNKKDYVIKYNLPKEIKAPVNIADKVGSALVIVDGFVVGEIDIISATMVEKQNYKDAINRVIDNFGFINN